VAPFNRILYPFDFTAPSLAGFHLARRVAVLQDAVLLHLARARPTTFQRSITASHEDEEKALRKLNEATNPLLGTVNHRWLVVTGDAATKIIEVAIETPADLIVMGTRGRGALSRLFKGSIAEHVVREAPCPVLLTRLR
jgi:universal stress protein A